MLTQAKLEIGKGAMTILFLAVLLVVMCFVAIVAVGRFGQLEEATHDGAPAVSPEFPIDSAQLARTRFATAFRGYRMDQVDNTLSAIGDELDARNQQIGALADRVATLTEQLGHIADSDPATTARPAGAAQAIDLPDWERRTS